MIKLDRSNTSFIGQWWWHLDRTIFIAAVIIMATGLVLVMASSPSKAEHLKLDHFHFVYRQIVFLIVGLIVMIGASFLPLVTLRRGCALGFLICLVLMLYVVLFGQEIKGARSWIHLPGFSLQPSEFMKPFFVVMTAWALAHRYRKEAFKSFPVAILLWIIVVALLMLQPDFGMTLLVSFVWGLQIFLAGLPIILIIIISAVGIAGALGAYATLDHVRHRVELFFHPTSGDNYQVDKAQEALMNGGFFGVGPGGGVIKSSVPDAHADFIFAVAGEEYGLIVCVLLVLLFAFLVVKSMVRILKQEDIFVVYAASGLVLLFAFQTLINIGVTLGLIPNTGMTLPLVSYGGSSIIASCLTLGILLSLLRKRYGHIRSTS